VISLRALCPLKAGARKNLVIRLAAIVLAGGAVIGGYFYLWPLIKESQERNAAVVAETKPLVDALLAGFAEGDYEKASAYFNGAMRSEMTEEVFLSARNQIAERIGNLVSLGEPEITREGENTILTYNAEFEGEDNVKIEVVFNKEGGEDWKISGLWFDSPKLRE
jgi:hypothetical protein